MKTGHPHYQIPSSRTVAQDVHVVFRQVKERIAEMLQVSYIYKFIKNTGLLTFEKKYDGRLNFATDAWTSPNQ